MEGTLRILGFLAGAVQGVVGDSVQHEALLLHGPVGLEGTLRILGLLAGAVQGVVGDNVKHEALQLHGPVGLARFSSWAFSQALFKAL